MLHRDYQRQFELDTNGRLHRPTNKSPAAGGVPEWPYWSFGVDETKQARRLAKNFRQVERPAWAQSGWEQPRVSGCLALVAAGDQLKT